MCFRRGELFPETEGFVVGIQDKIIGIGTTKSTSFVSTLVTSADYVEIPMKPSNASLIVLCDKRAQRVKIIYIAVLLDKNIKLTYSTKIKKYSQLKHEITEILRVKSTTVHLIVISATGFMHVRCLSQLKNLGVARVLAAAQKAVLLNTCRIVRSFLDPQEEGGQPLLDLWLRKRRQFSIFYGF